MANRIRAFSFRMRRAAKADRLLDSAAGCARMLPLQVQSHTSGAAGPDCAKGPPGATARRAVARMAVGIGGVVAVAGLAACSMLSGGSSGESEGATGGAGQNASTSGSDAGVGDGAAENFASGDGASVPGNADGSGSTSLDASTSGSTGSATGSDGSAATSLVYPPYAGNGTVDDGITQLNLYRTLLGQSQVTLDPVSSAGCAEHLQYLICAEAKTGTTGYLEHTETITGCVTDGGGVAGVESDLAWGESTTNGVVTDQSLGEAVDLWMNGLYHRNPLLDPGLTKAGAASSGGYNCLDYAAPGNTAAVRAPSPVLFPPEGTTDVPETFGGYESPCPTAVDPADAGTCGGSGFIVTANWYGWTGANGSSSAISAVSSVSMTDVATDAAVPLFAWYADTIAGHDPLPGYVHNEIALVPQASLAANTTYSVAIDATISGQATTLSWSFTTGTRAAPSL